MVVVRMLARMALVGVAVLTAGFVGATPAHAAPVDIDILANGWPTVAAAGDIKKAGLSLYNNANVATPPISVVIVVDMAGLTPSGVTMSRNGVAFHNTANGVGHVLLTDPTPITLAARAYHLLYTYQLQFTTAAPPGHANVGITAYSEGRLVYRGRVPFGVDVSNPGWSQPSPTAARPIPPGASPAGVAPSAAASARTASSASPATAGSASTAAAAPQPADASASGESGGLSSPRAGLTDGSVSGVNLVALVSVVAAALLVGGAILVWWLARKRRADRDDDDDVEPSGPVSEEAFSPEWPHSRTQHVEHRGDSYADAPTQLLPAVPQARHRGQQL